MTSLLLFPALRSGAGSGGAADDRRFAIAPYGLWQ
jgi:hypothetical protein